MLSETGVGAASQNPLHDVKLVKLIHTQVKERQAPPALHLSLGMSRHLLVRPPKPAKCSNKCSEFAFTTMYLYGIGRESKEHGINSSA